MAVYRRVSIEICNMGRYRSKILYHQMSYAHLTVPNTANLLLLGYVVTYASGLYWVLTNQE